MINRRFFIKTSALAGLGLLTFPQLSFQNKNVDISYDELIGKGQPKLFGKDFKLRKAAYDAFLKLSAEALKSDIRIQVVSSYRSFDHQKRIWERKYKRYIANGLNPQDSINKIIEYSTIPGTSRHHWGTDLDLIDANVKQPSHVLNPNHFDENGCYSKFKSWMDQHANTFGFHLVYTDIKERKGFKYEPWHYSYKPLSKPYIEAYQKLNLKDIIISEELMGCTHFSQEFITNYLNENILDINPELL
ncbi:M15 family metallopeptidase [Psychroserpens algicola]|uniref:M15 family metallopeptidase n=1 Tax=Psychroserpens algicola TaxID=1719034 RepID=A0ABT0HA69_9FLAO|nr:M15 family metallopeptidase [Psychroserpens algicola]MCK8481250.1 M15 family metallopeptidase [Psychroserpens algicola]